ncbi:MAG: ATP-binding cassette domain-containing protein, partial [Clostridia bacterium]|nr:ATP-binding cassette domain-containing protein [Clostridia bacterium]
LSEGQSQRISVARAILYDAPILLLDEATSALDEKTELAILTALKAQKDKTCILVSHKKAAFAFCDRAVEFADGKPVTSSVQVNDCN